MFDGLWHISPVAFILIPRLPGAFSTTRAVHICEGWWLSCRHGSVAEHWWLKPEVSWVRLLAAASLFTFLCFRLITCRFLQATVPCEPSQTFEAFRLITCRFLQATVPGEPSQTFEASVQFYMQIFASYSTYYCL